jgi:hypothetical protein
MYLTNLGNHRSENTRFGVQSKEKASTFQSRLSVFALPIFTVRAIYRHAVASVRWTLAGIIAQSLK